MPTKTSDDGFVVQRTYSDLELNAEETMDALMAMVSDMTDGDGDNSRALKIALGLYKKEAIKLSIFARLRMKLYREAEAAAMRLTAADSTLFDKSKAK